MLTAAKVLDSANATGQAHNKAAKKNDARFWSIAADTFWAIALALIACAALSMMGGCVTGKGDDGSTVVGFRTGATPDDIRSAGASGRAAGTAVGTVAGGPAGGVLGGNIGEVVGIIGATAAGIWATKRQRDARADARVAEARSAGLDAGWNERDAHQRAIDDAYDSGHKDARAAAAATPSSTAAA